MLPTHSMGLPFFVRVRSRDVSPSRAGCAGELADAVVLLVRVSVVRFDALVDGAGADRRNRDASRGGADEWHVDLRNLLYKNVLCLIWRLGAAIGLIKTPC
jgi:hypothetical protein